MLKGWFPVPSNFYVHTCVKFTLTSQIKWRHYAWKVACENSPFSSFFAAGYVSRGGTSATQQQKFHTDDVNQCLHNKYGSLGVRNLSLLDFMFLMVDYSKVLWSFVQELQQTLSQMVFLKTGYICLFFSRFITFTFDLWGLISLYPPPPPPPKKNFYNSGLNGKKTAGYAPVKVVRAFHDFLHVSWNILHIIDYE